MARLVRWVPVGQIFPRRPRAQNPEHAVQHGAAVAPRTATPVRSPRRLQHGREHGPLLVGEVHARLYDGTSDSVYEIGSSVHTYYHHLVSMSTGVRLFGD